MRGSIALRPPQGKAARTLLRGGRRLWSALAGATMIAEVSMRALCLALCLCPALAAAQRVAPIFTPEVPEARGPAELALTRALKAAGLVVVDATQSRAARSVDDLGRLIDGGAAPVVTDLDADVLIAARVRATPVQSALLGPDVVRLDVTLELRAIAVNTGEVLVALSRTAPGVGFGPAPAARKGAMGAVAALKADLVRALAAPAAGRVEVSIEGCPNVSACAGIADAIQGLDGVEAVAVLRARRGLSRLEVRGSMSPRALALSLDGATGLGLDVHGHGPGTVLAAFSPARSASVPVSVPPALGGGRHARLLADVVATALQTAGPVRVVRGDATAPLQVKGRARAEGRSVHISVTVHHGAATLAATQITCPRGDVAACLVSHAATLAPTLSAAVLADRRLSSAAPPTLARRARALVVESVQIEAITPALLGRYAQRPAAVVVLHNRSATPIEDVVVSARLPGFSESALDTRIPDIAAGARAEVPIRLALDRRRLARHDANVPAVLEVVAEYREAELNAVARLRQPVVVHDRNAMRWAAPQAVAAFVDARNAVVAARARAFAAAAPPGDPLGVPVALFAAMRGLRYVADPVHPFATEALDFVQYPAQTLQSGAGDCDDLAVLYAALAESVGRRALLLVTPRHALVAVESGWPPQARAQLSVDPARLIEFDGALFIPLEATALTDSFSAAWEKGAAVARGAVTRIDLRAAWGEWPPVDLSGVTSLPAPSVDGALVARWLEEARARYRAAVEARLVTLTGPQTASERGTLLAALGRSADARAALAEADDAAAINNLGNLQLAAGDLEAARRSYARAATAAPQEPRIQVNAALAAHAAGDAGGFADHVLACLDRGGADLIEALARAGVVGAGPALSAALHKVGRQVPDPGTVADAAEAPPIERLVYWL